MRDFDVTFTLDHEPDHDVIDQLIDGVDATIGCGHGGVHYITMTVAGDDCVSAAQDAIELLAARGVHPRRLLEDLVDRAAIAGRLGVTRQAVGLWVRGERKKQFPLPVNPVAGGVWLWGDVAAWAAEAIGYDTLGIAYPSQHDHDVINGELSATRNAPNRTPELV